nr:interleukin-32-like [Saimiri boliviensis boliviensis]
MGFPKVLSDDIKKLKAGMHQIVDSFIDNMTNEESEPEQELTPLLEGETDAVRRRGNRPPVLEVQDPKTQEPEESFCDMVKRWFRAMMQRLQTWWQKFVAWVKMVLAVVHAGKALWEEFQSFCCSLAELLGSFFSTKESH